MEERLSTIEPRILSKKYEHISFAKKLDNEVQEKRLEFWKNELSLLCLERRMVCLSVKKLHEIYKREDGSVPRCIGRVLVEMESKGSLVRLENFQSRGVSLYDVVMSPVRWVMKDDSTLKEPGEKDVFVLPKMLEVVRKYALSSLMEKKMFSESQMLDAAVTVCNNLEDAKFVVDYLKAQNDVVGLESGGYCVDGVELSEVDKSIYQLRVTLEALVKQEEALEALSKNLKDQARQCFPQHKSKAVALLKRKKMVDEALNKRLGITTNVQQVLLCVEGLKSDQMAFQAIKQGSETMKSVQEKSGLSVEAIEDVMNEFYELEADQSEVNMLITAGNIPDSEVEEELQGLLEENELEKQLEALTLSTPQRIQQNNNNNQIEAPQQEHKIQAKKQLVLE